MEIPQPKNFKKIFVSFSDDTDISESIVSVIKEETEKLGSDTIIFTRQKRMDNIFKNRFLHHNFRVVQFRADWYKDNENAGEIRDNKIFNYDIEKVILFSTDNENNRQGHKHIQYKCFECGIPLKLYIDGVLHFDNNENYPVTSKPKNKEEKTEEVKLHMKLYSKEYNDQLVVTTKKYKKIYYDGLKSRPQIKINEETDTTKKKENIKLSKSKIKKQYKTKPTNKNIKSLNEELFDL